VLLTFPLKCELWWISFELEKNCLVRAVKMEFLIDSHMMLIHDDDDDDDDDVDDDHYDDVNDKMMFIE